MAKSMMIAFLYAVLFLAEPATAQRAAFNDVRIRFNTNDRRQVESSASLIFDDTSRKVLIESGQKPIQINYGDVAQVIFDWGLRIHRRGAAKQIGLGTVVDDYRKSGGRGSESIGRTIDDRLAATEIKELTSRVMMIQTNTLGSMSPFVIEIGIDDANAVIAKAKQIFGKNIYITVDHRTVLSGNPKPIVLLEIGGASFSEWKQKP